MKTKTLIAWTVIIVISLIPAALLHIFGPRDYTSIAHTIGQIAGLVGMTMFALSFVLSTRLRFIEYLFDGLDKVYPVHSVLGATSLILLLMHPIFLVMTYIPNNIKLAAKYLLPGGLISVDFGIFALLGMIILLIITLYSKWKYHVWKFSHEFLGVAFILAVIHVLLVRDSVARDNIFNGYLIYAAIVSIIGITAFVYSFLLRTNFLGVKYKIKKITIMNECYEIILTPNNKGIHFKSGQFIFVKFHNAKIGKESHPFSIASASGNNDIRIIVKNLGDYTSNLKELRVGNMVVVEGPYGKFHADDYTDEVWVAGGIGITPFLGLAQDFKDGNVHLFYSVKSSREFICLKELQDIAKTNNNFKIYPWTTTEQGYLTAEEIAKKINLKNKKFYLCGPVSLKIALRKALISKGISKNNIHDERFAFK
ncbi:MAG: ferredoxin reductase family protein [Candidatus Woesearchaeota archaeon]